MFFILQCSTFDLSQYLESYEHSLCANLSRSHLERCHSIESSPTNATLKPWRKTGDGQLALRDTKQPELSITCKKTSSNQLRSP